MCVCVYRFTGRVRHRHWSVIPQHFLGMLCTPFAVTADPIRHHQQLGVPGELQLMYAIVEYL